MNRPHSMILAIARGRGVLALVAALSGTVPATRVAEAQTTALPGPLQTIVYRNAPFVLHETFLSANPVGASDHMLREDFNGNHVGYSKTADAANRAFVGDRTASVYFSATENGYYSDQGYYFVGYYWYHPRDNGADFTMPWGEAKHHAGHEHDLEGAYFLIRKSAYQPYGTIISALTQAHGELVPYKNYHQTVVPSSAANGSDYYAGIEFWNDARYSSSRPVVAVRGRNHGSHMAQIGCSGGTTLDGPFGIVPNSAGVFSACVHDGFDAIVYRPMMQEALTPSAGLPGADVIPIDTVHGVYTYQLLDVSTTLWPLRNTDHLLFSGPSLSLAGGNTGLTWFQQMEFSDDHANPMWQWRGGEGCRTSSSWIGSITFCWYGFGDDGTASYDTPAHWPVSTSPGAFLTNPQQDATLRFTNLPEIWNPMRYNPYVSAPPNYYGPQPFSGYISGPQNVSGEYSPNTWTAGPQYGVAPYTYQWSGALSGTGPSISGVIQNDYLYLDMWDAAGQHVATSIYVQSTGCPGSQIVC
jgi:hypothetical protein